MEKTYEIIPETRISDDIYSEEGELISKGIQVTKYNIHYYGGEWDGHKEFHSVDGVESETRIKSGYIKKQ